MKLGLTGTTRRSEAHADLADVADVADVQRAEHAPPQSTVRRGRRLKGGLRSDLRPMSLTPSTPPAPRKERNALETKRRILHAAEREFAAKGFDGARLGIIARAADVQQALIHHY